jgi:hypothetical protein
MIRLQNHSQTKGQKPGNINFIYYDIAQKNVLSISPIFHANMENIFCTQCTGRALGKYPLRIIL